MFDLELLQIINSATKHDVNIFTSKTREKMLKISNFNYDLMGIRISPGEKFRIIIKDEDFLICTADKISYVSFLFHNYEKNKQFVDIAKYIVQYIKMTHFHPESGLFCFYCIKRLDRAIEIYDCLAIKDYTVDFLLYRNNLTTEKKIHRAASWRRTNQNLSHFLSPKELKIFVKDLDLENVFFPQVYNIEARLLPNSLEDTYNFIFKLFELKEDVTSYFTGGVFVVDPSVERKFETKIFPYIYNYNSNLKF